MKINLDKKDVSRRNMIIADGTVLILASLFGLELVATKVGVSHIGPFILSFWKFFIGGIIMASILWKKMMNIEREDIKAGMIMGGFTFLGYIFTTIGIMFIDVGIAGFLLATYTIFVPIISAIVYKEKPEMFAVIGVIVCMIGIGLLTLDGDLKLGKGELIMLVGALFMSMDILSTEYYAKRRDPSIIATIQLITVGILSFLGGLIFESGDFFNIPKEAFGSLAYMILFGAVLAHLAVAMALKFTNPTHFVIIVSTESVFAAAFGFLFFNEMMTSRMIFGCTLILFAIILVETELSFLPFMKRRKEQKESRYQEKIENKETA